MIHKSSGRSAWERLRWTISVAPETIEEATADIDRLFSSAVQRRDLNLRLDRLLASLGERPFSILGFPPMKTSDSNVFRFYCDRHSAISMIADLYMDELKVHIHQIWIRPPVKEHL